MCIGEESVKMHVCVYIIFFIKNTIANSKQKIIIIIRVDRYTLFNLTFIWENK